ncbi:MAG TPA: gluconate 2-dehydrogenase subunit 3 family protein [Blastocatellia bacterium]|nr:gluconate 2-dehydrogenase subunit 3 family protein [Blastocatellia bacterium]
MRIEENDVATDEPNGASGEEMNVTRRDMLKLAAAAAISIPLVGVGGAAEAATETTQAKAPLFFTPEEFAMVDEISELIIPTDEHSPGARAAQCAAYIDARLAESWTEEPKTEWRNGLKAIDAASQEISGKPFMQATAEQRVAVLTAISKNEKDPKKPEERFFNVIKSRTVHAYYSSKIGIHQEMEYKGNVPIKEFVGFDVRTES